MRPPTHLMFSHTAKGQEYNMPLLAHFIAPSWASNQTKQHFPCLIDYELLTDENGKRTVGFGWFAGVAGVLESLAAMAQHHLKIGITSPFLVCSFFLYRFVPLAYSSPAHPSPVYPTYHQKTLRIVVPHRVLNFTKQHTTWTQPLCDQFDWVGFHVPIILFINLRIWL